MSVFSQGRSTSVRPKVAICSRLLVDWPAQVQHLDDPGWAQVKIGPDSFSQKLVAHLAGPGSINHDGNRVGHPDGVGQLDFTAVSQASGDNVLSHVARSV